MSLKDLIEDDASRVVLNTADFAETVVRWPQGASGSAVSVSGVWLPEEPERNASENGEWLPQRGELQVAESVTVHRSDAWIIGGQRFETEVVEEPDGGMRFLQLVRVDRIRKSRNGDMLL